MCAGILGSRISWAFAMRRSALAIVVSATLTACGASYSDSSKCDVLDPDSSRLALCVANRPPFYCGGDNGTGGGTSLPGGPHAFRYQNQSDHVC